MTTVVVDDASNCYSEFNSQSKRRGSIYLIAICSSLTGLLLGYDTGIIVPTVSLLEAHNKSKNVDWIQPLMLLGCIAGSLQGTRTVNTFGRPKTITLGAALSILGTLCFVIHDEMTVLALGRILTGAGIGLASMAGSIYVTETSPTEVRGNLLTLNALLIALGQFVAFYITSSELFTTSDTNTLKAFVAASEASIVMLQLVILFFLPESPRWLLSLNRYDEAHDVLKQLRTTYDNVDEEYLCIRTAVSGTKNLESPYQQILLPNVRKAMTLGICLQALHQLLGIQLVMYYSTTILDSATISHVWVIGLLNCTNFVFTAFGLYFVETIGRRLLSLISLGAVAITLLLIGGIQIIMTSDEGLSWIILALLLSYVAFFAIGLSSTAATINAEIFPQNVRGLCISITSSFNWLCTLLISWSVIPAISQSGSTVIILSASFFIAAFIGTIGWWYLYHMLPETNQLSLEDIQSTVFSEDDDSAMKNLPLLIPPSENDTSITFRL